MKSPDIKDHSEVFGSVAIVTLLILTAWGNFTITMIVSTVGIIAGLILYKRDLFRGHSLVTTVGFIAAAAIAIALALRS